MKRLLHHRDCSCRDLSRRDVVNTIFGAGLIIGGLGMPRAHAEGLKLRGAVKIDGQAASEGQVIKTGSTVEVAPGAEAAFAVGNDAFILRPASGEAGGGATVVVEGSGTTVATMRLIEGGLLSVFGKGDDRKVIGSTATIGIRGTGFYMESQRRRTYVCYCYGDFELFANDSPRLRERVHSKHHDGARFITLGAHGARVKPITLSLGHTDQDLIAAEHSVGRKAPFET